MELFQLDNHMGLREIGKGQFLLTRNNNLCACPFRQAEFVPKPRSVISDVQEFERKEMKCGSWCPHFSAEHTRVEGEQTTVPMVHLSCGAGNASFYIEEIQTPKKADA